MIMRNNLILFRLCFRRLFIQQRGAPFILMYHRVLNPASSAYCLQPGMFVSLKSFELHLRVLKKQYTVLPLRELLEGCFVKKKALKNCCAITFDDGWLDNYTNAFPLLMKYRMPATIFLATRYIGQDLWFWEEEVALYLRKNSQKFIDAFFKSNLTASQYGKMANLAGDSTEIIYLMKQLDGEQREKIVQQIGARNLQIENKNRIVINWDEAREMQGDGVDFFSHSHSHILLSGLDYDEAEKDIRTSLALLKKNVVTVQDIFCYPSGRFSDKIIDILKDNGIKYALTTQRAPLTLSKDAFSVPRIGVHDDISHTSTLFKLNLN